MIRRTNSASLHCESLEARDVPAVVIDGTFNGSTTVATGGRVNIAELGGAITSFDSGLLNPEMATLSDIANDNISLSTDGARLTVNSSDGIYIRVTNMGGMLVRASTTVQVENATGLNVNLQLGGNDRVTDNSMLNATINGGPGNDSILSAGMAANPQLIPLITFPLSPTLFPLLGTMGGAKILQGGDGDDSITGPLVGFLNQFDGGSGNDVIVGGLGPDVLIGGDGVDVLNGLGGSDFYGSFDFFFDYNLNFAGDVVSANTFDFVQTP